MNKNILFIEDDFTDFKYFSTILKQNSYNIYPPDNIGKDQVSLSFFLHSQTYDYQRLKNNVFDYIINEKLYEDKLLFLILDINLLDKDRENKLDESGKNFLSDFRNNFYTYFKKKKEENKRYKNWSNSIWTIALTNFSTNKCRQLESEFGNFMCALNKKDIKAANQYLITKLNNMETQKINDKEYNGNPLLTVNIETGNNSPIIIGDGNTVQSYNNNVIKLKNELINKYTITQSDADELGQILQDEKQKSDNETLISKMKKWWGKITSYVRDLSIEILGNLLVSLYLLQSEQIAVITNAIQG
ncbi:MAG: hypothetical protein LBF69_05495 [Prevotellaceae bacterium]|jgi:hypothetical protein|nr:hypothetical protein [Prevotellaceae bacterium]